MSVPKPSNEEERLKALQECGLLDSAAEPVFDSIVRLAKEICQVPVALITLVDQNRQWIKAKIGCNLSETSREDSFCAYTILQPDELLIVPDALSDKRFATNPLVIGEPKIRFYTGVPVTTQEGYTIGALCVIDYEPRELTPAQIQSLKDLGRQVEIEFQRRRATVLRASRATKGPLQQNNFFGQLLGGFGFASVTVITIGAISFWSGTKVVQSNKLISHTFEVISNVEQLNAEIRDVQRATRGYVITAQERYLKPYYQAIDNIDPQIQKLYQLTADNLQQQQNINELKPLIKQQLSIQKQVILVRQQRDFLSAARLVQKGEGNDLMEQIGSQLSKIKREEERLLAERIIQARNTQQVATIIILAATLITLMITVAMLYLTYQEIQRRKQAEDQNEEQRELLEVTLSSIGDAVIVIDSSGNVTFMNPIAESLTGWLNDQKQSHHFNQIFKIINIATGQSLQSPFEEVLQTSRIQGLLADTGLLHRSGRVIPIDDSCSPIFNRYGVLQGAVMIFRDITERRRVETEVQRTLIKEKELSELKSSFISMVSHEFRTPLTTILSSTELLENPGTKATEEKRQRHFRRIYDAIQRMQVLLNDVLLISRAESGKLSYDPSLLNLNEFCQTLIEAIQVSVDSTHEIVLSYKSSYHDVYMDQKLLQHILTNLLSNAVKYSPMGGKIYFEFERQDDQGIFRIQDEGIGIPPEDLPSLFSSFNRASNVDNISGTGLGLFIVKTCVELHRGEIDVTSELNKGTVFTVRLPLDEV